MTHVEAVVAVLNNPETKPADRLAAADELITLGWGPAPRKPKFGRGGRKNRKIRRAKAPKKQG